MSFFELAQDRYSVRAFSDRKINGEQIQILLDAAQLAPTAVNKQPQRIYVLKSEEALDKIRSLTKMTYGAPLVMLVCHDKDISWKAENYGDPFDSGEMDSTISATFMMMEATELGIGSLWARGFNAREIENAFEMPENIVLDCLLDFGYPASESKPSEMHFIRNAVNDVVVVL